MRYDIVVIGAGPAGLAAGIYGKRAGLNVLILDASPLSGGQILSTYEIDNYPGLPGLSGPELSEKMRAHCDKLSVEFATGRVKSIIDHGDYKELVTRKATYEAKSVIIATGASNKRLGCPGEDQLSGMGVSYCATCDGAFFKEKTVAVVGGGDVALEDALYLARGCAKVYLIHRRDAFRGAAVLQDQVKATANIEIIYDTVVDSINGTACVESLTLRNKNNENITNIAVDGVFIAVGTEPNTAGIEGLPDTNEAGYIIAGEDGITSIAGIYAAGDVRTKQLRQVITATADGANAVTSADRYLQSM